MFKKIIGASRPRSAQSVGNAYQEHVLFDYRGLGRQINPAIYASYAPAQDFASTVGQAPSTGVQPQCGMECVTLLLQGQLDARDSEQRRHTLHSGDILWHSAGRGLLSELRHGADLVQNGGQLELLTLWVNLPAQFKLSDPHCQYVSAADVPEVALPEGGGTLRVIAGEYGGAIGPAETVTPLQLWDLRLLAGRAVTLPLPSHWYTVLLVLEGRMYNHFWPDVIDAPQLVVFDAAGEEITFEAKQNSRAVLLSCQSLDEAIAGSEALVMNTEDQLMQARTRLQSGMFGEISDTN
jgi:hypothetical protein